MRWLPLIFLLACLPVQSADWVLTPEHAPKAIYPLELQRAGVIGEVRVSFMVKPNGTVNRIGILTSAHPELSRVATEAIEQWRFKPWAGEGGAPAQQEVIAPMVFRFDVDVSEGANEWLKALKCRDINEKLGRSPEYAWIDAAVFHYTRAYVSDAANKMQVPDERRLAMIAKLNRRVSRIVWSCRESPTRDYMKLLPEDIRALLSRAAI